MSSDAGRGMLLVLSAPSGAGKTTLARMFLARHPEARFSVSVTTRAPRGAERDGFDYHFVTRERFEELVRAGAFAEWAEVHGQRYGTLRAPVEEALSAGHIALFDIDVQGGAQLLDAWPREAVAVFVLPPSMEELARRLRSRSTDSQEQIARRLAAARAEIERGVRRYHYVLVNDDLEPALASLEAIVSSARARLSGADDPASDAAAARLRAGGLDLRAWLA